MEGGGEGFTVDEHAIIHGSTVLKAFELLVDDLSCCWRHRTLVARSLDTKRVARNDHELIPQIESFLHLYSHLTSPAELAPVTDMLCFASRIQRPGIWEEMVK